MPSAHRPRFLRDLQPEADVRAELAQGLLQPQAAVSPRFLYDALGAALFQAITELPEYYPTRTEAALMQRHAEAIATAVRAALPAGFALVDLGAGDGAKAERLFATLRPAHYVALDIAEDPLRRALTALQQRHPALPVSGVIADFSQHLSLPSGVHDGPSLVFYPGSSIGNFAPGEALRLLQQARELSAGGALLIGADLVKPRAVLEAAYDDALGVTAAFNLNLLRHVNRLLGSDFEVRDWQHVALFDEAQSRIEMHLQARRGLSVRWPGARRRFAAGERVHTENSYKWTTAAFEALLRRAGWREVQAWQDERGWFGVFFARA
ncbi:MAG: L-histidine N(alpha)-methyltransferase [Proteobacteria bacterium]|nr:L-histidine N(alpha)-methyltransferase [Pseudomonadota bacterium]